EVPHVEIGDLRAVDGRDAEDLTGTDRPRTARAARHDERVDERARAGLRGETSVELPVHVERRARLRLVDHARSCHPLHLVAPPLTLGAAACLIPAIPTTGRIIAPSREGQP